MKALFFGSIGSVVETSELQRQSFNRAFADHVLNWVWDRAMYAEMLKTSGGALRIATYAAARGQSVDAGAIHRTKTQLFLEGLAHDGIPPRPGVVDLLKYAQGAGLMTGFISTTEQATVDLILGKLTKSGVAPLDLVTSRAIGLDPKPSPAAYRYALKTLSLDPSQAIVIEDNLDGVQAAHGAGVRVIAYPGDFDDPADFKLADGIVTDALRQTVIAILAASKASA
ncbi:MAG: HAD-IA family hydrolase [Pseudomonadota bacterium]